jgi:hypothetical protein
MVYQSDAKPPLAGFCTALHFTLTITVTATGNQEDSRITCSDAE